MSEHKATIIWKGNPAEFQKRRYSREHTWEFDGGAKVQASSSPSVVPVPLSNAAAVDPEEAFVASVASCHMLWFLHLARDKGFVVESYTDEAVGHMAKNSEGAFWISTIKLKPKIHFAGDKSPTPEELHALHHSSHEKCFIANSIKTEVTVETAHG